MAEEGHALLLLGTGTTFPWESAGEVDPGAAVVGGATVGGVAAWGSPGRRVHVHSCAGNSCRMGGRNGGEAAPRCSATYQNDVWR